MTSGGLASLLTLGILLALYDGAEVVLKPVFGTLADRMRARPVLLLGLVGFAAASVFSPSASTLVARLNPSAKRGRAFGSYGFYKSLGYTLGPLLGGVVVASAGLRGLFVAMAVLAAAVAVWVWAVVPVVAPLPRRRQTLVDLGRRLVDPSFLRPTTALAAATAALSVGVGFLPVTGSLAGHGSVLTGAVVSVLALTAAFVQPWRTGLVVGSGLTALGLVAPLLPGLAGVLVAALLIGTGTGLVTPLGFAALSRDTPEERMGQTMGSAELGRELGDAGGPLLVAFVATAVSLEAGYVALAVLVGVLAVVLAVRVRTVGAR